MLPFTNECTLIRPVSMGLAKTDEKYYIGRIYTRDELSVRDESSVSDG